GSDSRRATRGERGGPGVGGTRRTSPPIALPTLGSRRLRALRARPLGARRGPRGLERDLVSPGLVRVPARPGRGPLRAARRILRRRSGGRAPPDDGVVGSVLAAVRGVQRPAAQLVLRLRSADSVGFG